MEVLMLARGERYGIPKLEHWYLRHARRAHLLLFHLSQIAEVGG